VHNFVKKPVVIRAILYTGNVEKLPYVFGSKVTPSRLGDSCFVSTLEGDMECRNGDWLIEGIKGEIYPCKPDIFSATYAPITRYDESVNWFAQLMKDELIINDEKGDWSDCAVDFLLNRLAEEVKELTEAVHYDVGAEFVKSEAADVANFALMIAQNYARNKSK